MPARPKDRIFGLFTQATAKSLDNLFKLPVAQSDAPEHGQFGPEDTAEGYRKHRIEIHRRGPDNGSKETMQVYHKPY